MSVPFVVLVRDPANQTFSWIPVIAPSAEQSLGMVAQNLEKNGRTNLMLVGAFTRDQVFSCQPLFDQMDDIIRREG